MSKFLNNVSLNDNQLQNFVIQNAPAGAGITAGNRKGAAYFDSSANLLYINDGSGYITYQIKNANGTITVADPINPTDAANKQYVDGAIQGISAKDAVDCATTVNISNLLTGAPNIVDGFSLSVGNRVLVKDQTTQSQNGIYTVTTVGSGGNGVWARSYDANIWSEIINAYVLVTNGTSYASTGWVCTVPVGVGTLDTTNITWVQFSQAGVVTGNNLGSGGSNIFEGKTGASLNFRQIKGSGNITVTENTNDITLSVTGGGTVTTITNTKGIIGFINPTSTPDITITGTSGGIPYFNSATTWTTSALLTARGVMLGGGAATAPRAISALGTAGQPLLSGGAGADPAFGALSLSTATSVTGILAAANGGTGNGFTKFSGPTTSEKTYILPDASDTIATLGAIQTFTAQKSFSSIKFDSVTSITGAATAVALFNTDITTGSISIGGALTSGSLNLANGTAISTNVINLGSGVVTSSRTININCNGGASAITTTNIGTNSSGTSSATYISTGCTGTSANVTIGTATKSLVTINGSVTLSVLTTAGIVKTTSGGVISSGLLNLASASEVTGILAAANGGTGNGFTKFSGATTVERTYTLPNQSGNLTMKKFIAVTGAVGGVWTVDNATHGLGTTQQIQVSVQISATGEVVYPDIMVDSGGTVTLFFATNPADNVYSVLLIG